jgi:hypothetical protein
MSNNRARRGAAIAVRSAVERRLQRGGRHQVPHQRTIFGACIVRARSNWRLVYRSIAFAAFSCLVCLICRSS